MDILEIEEHLDKKKAIKCYAIIQLQEERIKDLIEKIEHLEKLLQFRAQIIDFNKD